MHRFRSAIPLLASIMLAPSAALAQSATAAVDGVTPAPAVDASISDAEARANAGPLDAVQQQALFGDWELRKRLADKGISFAASWTLEPGWNERGYKGSGWSAVSSAKFGMTFDLGKLGIVDDGKVQTVLTDRFGQGINDGQTGGYLPNQAFYGQGKEVRFNELSYEQTFLDNRLSLKGGFYAMGNDFGKLPYTCNFTNAGNCGHPLGPVYSSGWRDDPTGQWGGRIKWTAPSGWYFQTGVYDVNPLRARQGHGFDLSFNGTTGAFIPVEVGYNYGTSPADYAGTIRVGGYYDTSRANVLGEPGQTVAGRSGFLIEAAQQIWKPHPNSVRGIAVFGVFTMADRETGLFRTYWEAGASWRGPFASRPDDIFSASWTHANINDRVGSAELLADKDVQTFEQMFEVNYGVQVAPWLLVRPTVQYVVRPGGYQSRPNTAVILCHLQATF